MGLFKRKTRAFGESIEPDCAYCRFNEGEETVACPYKAEGTPRCKHYEYDPTMRAPKGAPKLKKFNKDDFSL